MNWYYVENGQRVGPVNDGNLNRLLKEGTVKPETLVWRDGLEKWVPYSKMSIGAEAVAAARAGVCSECGKSFPGDDLAEGENGLVCPACKPLAEEAPAALDYAGFWSRAGARIMDSLILYTINMILSRATGIAPEALYDIDNMRGPALVLLTVSVCVQLAYFTWFVGRFGATPGKIACGLKIVRPDGSPVTYARAFGRVFAETLSGLTFFAGYIMAAFDGQKRALHDRVCDTRVIHA